MQELPANPRNRADLRQVTDDLYSFLGTVRRGWRLLLLALAVSLTVATIHVVRLKTTYAASARVQVLQQGRNPVRLGGGGDAFDGAASVEDLLATHLIILKSPLIIQRALAECPVRGLSISGVAGGLKVSQPSPAAKVIALEYNAETAAEAEAVLKAIIAAYEVYLKENYQQNSSEVIKLIAKVRDELSADLKQLDDEFLTFRKNNTGVSTDGQGRTTMARRLEQWDQSVTIAVGRAIQLEAQLELGKKLVNQGAGFNAITNALNQIGSLGGPASSSAAPMVAAAETGTSLDRLQNELNEVKLQRMTAERLLEHLRAESMSLTHTPPPAGADPSLRGNPTYTALQAKLQDALGRRDAAFRLARKGINDPSVISAEGRVRAVQREIEDFVQQRRRDQASGFAPGTGNDPLQLAQTNLVTLRAREAALSEQVDQMRAEQVARLQSDLDQVVADQGPDHVRAREIRDQIGKLTKSSDRAAGSSVTDGQSLTLLESLQRSLESIQSLKERLVSQYNTDLVENQKAEIVLLAESNLKNDLDRQRTLFNSVVDQLKGAQLVSDFESVSAQTIDPPSIRSVRPNYPFVFLVASLAGLVLGVGGAYLADIFDARLRTLSQIREALDMPVLGIIPTSDVEQLGVVGKVGLLSKLSPRSALAESYKSTRTNLEFLRRNHQAQVLLVSSPSSGDGKTTTASNLAVTLAQAGRKVLLIDGDLRKPSQHLLFDLPRDPGLVDILRDRMPPAQVIQTTTVENLDFIATGADIASPAELLSSPHLGDFLRDFRQCYDTIIFDSSPMLAVTDPSIIAANADGIILVVRVGDTRRHDLDRVREILRILGIPVLGAILNGVSREHLGYGYGYGYGYAYGYGYGYGHGNNRPYGSAAPQSLEETRERPSSSESHA